MAIVHLNSLYGATPIHNLSSCFLSHWKLKVFSSSIPQTRVGPLQVSQCLSSFRNEFNVRPSVRYAGNVIAIRIILTWVNQLIFQTRHALRASYILSLHERTLLSSLWFVWDIIFDKFEFFRWRFTVLLIREIWIRDWIHYEVIMLKDLHFIITLHT